MPTFKFKEPNEARAGITEDQARKLGYVTKGPSSPKDPSEKNKYWKIKHFGYEEAKLVATGKRRGNPNNPKSYWTGAKFLKDEQGRKIEVQGMLESRVKEIALQNAADQVVRAKLGIEMDEVEPYEHRKHDLLLDHWQTWREGIKTDNPHESPKTSKAYNTTLRFLQIHYPEMTELRHIKDDFFSWFKKTNNGLTSSHGKPFSTSYLNRNEKRMERFLLWLKGRRYLSPKLILGECNARKNVPGHNHRVNNAQPFKDKEELYRFLDHVESTPIERAMRLSTRKLWAARFRLLAFSGIRSGDEAHGLEWSDISDTQIEIRDEIAKGKNGRMIGLLPQAKKALETIRALEADKKFPSKDSKVIGGSYALLWWNMSLWVKGFYEEEDRHTTPHMLRAFFVNHLVDELQAPINIVKQWSGDNIQTLEKHYMTNTNTKRGEAFLQNVNDQRDSEASSENPRSREA
jgi:integrase